ncbi:hypothetical protein BCR36DRAFT_584905 [Piromyces finnis]|uniref:C3H1-type domain-containing protein n=1 Tax=Piromyces finnis TaxID=1754191 RepID=A0A1Y1V4P2_9FUNG|nr:hypothetical protein BCR36DRAFT_584905 [Piromyces finnis]|eukprot:ORX47091.1 hypothetical protein BCR36DRAFT_584905 [Piromyces finnis]
MFPTTRFSNIECVFYPNCEKGDLCPFAHNKMRNNQKIKIKSYSGNSDKYSKNNYSSYNNSNNISSYGKKSPHYSPKADHSPKKTYKKINVQSDIENHGYVRGHGRNSSSGSFTSLSRSKNYSMNSNSSNSSSHSTRMDEEKRDNKRYRSNSISSNNTVSVSSNYHTKTSSSSSYGKINTSPNNAKLMTSSLPTTNVKDDVTSSIEAFEKKYENSIVPGSIPKIYPTAISKIPRNVRQKMALTFFKEFQRIYQPILSINPDLARQHSIDQEKALYDKSSKKTYKVSASHILTHLKQRNIATSIQDTGIDGIYKPPSAIKKEEETFGISEADYKLLLTYLVKDDQFKTLNYPTMDLLNEYNSNKDHREEILKAQLEKIKMEELENKNKNRNPGSPSYSSPSNFVDNSKTYGRIFSTVKDKIKTCARCQSRFTPKKNSDVPLLTDEEKEACSYHFGKLRKTPHSQVRLYSCCDGTVGSEGCTRGPHVWKCETFDGLQDDIPFTQLPDADPSNKKLLKVVALDCEMSYTTGGLELTRITVVDWKGNTVLDELCKPHNCIIDLNTRYSGIKELSTATLDLDGVKEKMAEIMSKDTIIIGQGLENDLNALRLIHEKVIDTVLLYPHPMGLPWRFGLRYLANKYLQRFIQDGTDGHDSYEDSKTCIDLVKLKIQKGPNFGIIHGV